LVERYNSLLMAREVQVEGVVLRRWYAGEYDKWVSLLTPDCGKLRLRVRGGRKPKSKMGMLTEPLSRIKARVVEGRGQRLLVQPQLVRSYVNVRLDLERLTIALALGETLDRWLPEEHPEPEVYAVLVDALGSLEGEALPAGVAAWAIWRWLAVLGYAPEVGQCARCGAAGGDGCVIVSGHLWCARAPRATTAYRSAAGQWNACRNACRASRWRLALTRRRCCCVQGYATPKTRWSRPCAGWSSGSA
jgi:DNA repair protein RecO (recombination protein O)